MNAYNNVAGVTLNTAPVSGFTGGVAALAAIPHPEAKLFTCAAMFAVAVGSAMRTWFAVAPVTIASTTTATEYPFDTRTLSPWQHDGSPLGL